MELREALTQITEIRLQMARTEVFRGYRAVPAAFSGLVALLASAVQSLTVQDPVQQINAYLGLWIGAALISGMSAVLEMGVRARNATSPLTRELTFLAMEQFCPCLVAGALVTMVVVHSRRRASGSCLASGRCFTAWASSPPAGFYPGQCSAWRSST